MRGLDQKPVIVTGGASGIGKAIGLRLGEEGARVAIFDMNEKGAEAAAAEIRQKGGEAWAYKVDITDYAAVARAVDAFEKAAGQVYGLVNNAGWDEAKPFIQTEPDFWKKVIDINLYGPLNLTHVVARRLAEQGAGRVVSISSDAGRVGSSGEAVYSAAKGGVIAFMKTMAREFARKGVTFNTICPGPTDTPLLASVDASGGGRLTEALTKAIPMRRLAQPDDYPGMVAFFLSDDASFITGQTISVSGGLSMHG
ncbi:MULTISPECIES: SDR family NAD(P)-dependent oxidoreductase [Parvibaculum]|jgi:2-hydroxycyclohexanecarboxyl-CoA dehydrogenase|uniref:Short-chain dehydrogenase/reductase SDR n=2 Tax=Hyphomicrobiales TaxID=356 RepID=A7HU05_PARL1|nr:MULTISPECIES: SDR family NAD(P)-dependent oxidoreductase [Parvibaculum]ADI19690.1 8 dehydrogenases with different specificities (related to short-chain alcohol dehydrogenases) [uncultured Rhizobiales bacterium HF4000_48A13]ABS63388.1 short-chain dehydrogenase/reductase SDR [Parvibaculum lavamentivorans DS-1]MBX3497477.1 SDR family oxidoreductase [Parvibaculum sp.]MCW5726773.1 SDR family oxidoreductase [Parvibaculum sp.]MDP1628749.1 SDR family NAD(P)-dependent oxidoreductase [Parvibaculum sp